MTFRTETIIKKNARPHRCDYCGSTIPAGAPSIKIAGHWDGSFYTARGHIDCVQMWNEAYETYSDDYEGMPFNLFEAIEPDESRAIVEAAYNHFRGRYPHVICRLELRWQRSDLADRDRYLKAGLEPDPEDYPEVYG